MAKKLDFTGAIVNMGGCAYRDLPDGGRHVLRRTWYVTLATGGRYKTRDYPRSSIREWQKFSGRSEFQTPHWRKASRDEAAQVEAFTVRHPDYLPNDMIEPPAPSTNVCTCMGCGCTDDHACVDERGVACHWVKVDRAAGTGICSQCAPDWLQQLTQTVAQGKIPIVRHCPKCGSTLVASERRPDGNSTCGQGHVFPTASAEGE